MIRNLFIILATGIFNNVDCLAINGDITNKSVIETYGGSNVDYFESSIPTSDGGKVNVGSSASWDAGFDYKGGTDAIIMKYNSKNELEWKSSFGGSADDYYTSVTETQDGGFVCVGYSYSWDAWYTNNGLSDAVLVKYDSTGKQLWVKNYGFNNREEFNSIIELGNGDLIAVGISFSQYTSDFTGKGEADAIIGRFDQYGNKLWVKSLGSYLTDCFKSVIKTQDNGFVVAGYSNSYDLGFNNQGNYDAFIIKYDSNGNQLWIKSFGSSNVEKFYSVIEARNGDLICVGETYAINSNGTDSDDRDAIMIRYTKDGSLIWKKILVEVK